MGNTICALGDAASMPVLGFVKKFGARIRILHRARPLDARRPLVV
jgi:NADH:ubiquinone oxidoreductase subunit F (NADH-binding)